MAFRFLPFVFIVVFLSLLDGRFPARLYGQERIPADGPCKNKPVDKNDSSAGKANNRRVEFIKK